MGGFREVLADVANKGFKSGWEALKSIKTPIAINGVQRELGEYISTFLKDTQTQVSTTAGQLASEVKATWDAVPDAARLAYKQAPNTLPAQRMATNSFVQQVGGQVTARNPKLNFAQDFFPKVFKPSITRRGSEFNELVDHIVQTNQLPSAATGITARGNAETLLTRLIGMQRGRNGVVSMHDLMGLQVPDKFLESDPKIAFGEWARAASEYVVKFDKYGGSNQNLKALVDAAGQESRMAGNLAFAAINSHEYGGLIMKNYRPFYEGKNAVELALREFEGLTKLGRVGIAEPSQSLNTLIFNSLSSFGKGIGDFISNPKDAMDFSLKAGTLLHESLQDWRNAVHGRDSWLSTMLHYTGFDAFRKMNIVLAANTSKHYVQELAEKLMADPASKEANTMLRVLGLEPSAVLRQGGVLNPEQILGAARRGVEATQFLRNPLDLPIYWNKNPMMRILTLYKSFIFDQAKFTKDYVFKSWDKGKPENIAYMALLFPVIGEIIGDAETLARGQNPNDRLEMSPLAKAGVENEFALRYVDNLARVGHIGMFYSMMGALNRGNVTNWLAGPVAGDIEDILGGAWKLAKGDGSDSLMKAVLGRVPVVGPALKNTLTE